MYVFRSSGKRPNQPSFYQEQYEARVINDFLPRPPSNHIKTFKYKTRFEY